MFDAVICFGRMFNSHFHENIEFSVVLGSAIVPVLYQTIDWDGGQNARESEKQRGDGGSDICSNDSADTILVEDENAEIDDC